MVVGHGMVGHRFVEALRSRDADGTWRVTVLAEETDAAYDRVGLTGYTEHWDRGLLALPGNDYAGDDRVELRLGCRGRRDRPGRQDGAHRSRGIASTTTRWSWRLAHMRSCRRCPAATCLHATSTAPSTTSTRSAPTRCVPWTAAAPAVGVVIGGGLLGLEAANALRQFGLQTHVVEMAPRLMAQQLDEAGGALLGRMIDRARYRRACRRRHRRDPPGTTQPARPAIRR